MSVQMVPAQSYLAEVCVKNYCYSLPFNTMVNSQAESKGPCANRAKFSRDMIPSDTYDFSRLAAPPSITPIAGCVIQAAAWVKEFVSMIEWVCEIEWVGEGVTKFVWMSEFVSECEWVSVSECEWVWASEWVRKWGRGMGVGECEYEWAIQWVNEGVKEGICEREVKWTK